VAHQKTARIRREQRECEWAEQERR
jgi:hypothetical protein